MERVGPEVVYQVDDVKTSKVDGLAIVDLNTVAENRAGLDSPGVVRLVVHHLKEILVIGGQQQEVFNARVTNWAGSGNLDGSGSFREIQVDDEFVIDAELVFDSQRIAAAGERGR